MDKNATRTVRISRWIGVDWREHCRLKGSKGSVIKEFISAYIFHRCLAHRLKELWLAMDPRPVQLVHFSASLCCTYTNQLRLLPVWLLTLILWSSFTSVSITNISELSKMRCKDGGYLFIHHDQWVCCVVLKVSLTVYLVYVQRWKSERRGYIDCDSRNIFKYPDFQHAYTERLLFCCYPKDVWISMCLCLKLKLRSLNQIRFYS